MKKFILSLMFAMSTFFVATTAKAEDVKVPLLSCYVNGGLGIGVASVDVDGQGATLRGLVVPVGGGCDFRVFGQFSAGVDGSYTLGRMTTDSGSLSGIYKAGVRVGYNFTQNLMAYAKLSYAAGQLASDAQKVNLVGLPVALGTEFKISEHLGLRLEYEHINWRDKDVLLPAGLGADVRTRTDSVTASAVYRF